MVDIKRLAYDGSTSRRRTERTARGVSRSMRWVDQDVHCSRALRGHTADRVLRLLVAEIGPRVGLQHHACLCDPGVLVCRHEPGHPRAAAGGGAA